MRDLWRRGSVGRLLLQRVHDTGERQRRMPEDCQPGIEQDRSVLRAQEVRIQAAINGGRL